MDLSPPIELDNKLIISLEWRIVRRGNWGQLEEARMEVMLDVYAIIPSQLFPRNGSLRYLGLTSKTR
jgi:hypothetical protein